MKIQKYLTKLQGSKQFKDFMKENSDAFLMAGFFILDLEAGKSAHQINYFIPSKKKVAIFSVDNKIAFQLVDTIGAHPSPTPLDLKTEIDLDTLPGILEDEMKNRNITDEIKKIIAIVQNVEGKKVWNLNCVLSGMNILKAHVDDNSKTVLKMEKSSIMDYIQKMPTPPGMKGMQGAPGAGKPQIQIPGAQPEAEEQPTGDQINEEMNKLNKLEEAIEKEKEVLKSEMIKEEKAKAVKSEKKKAKSKK